MEDDNLMFCNAAQGMGRQYCAIQGNARITWGRYLAALSALDALDEHHGAAHLLHTVQRCPVQASVRTTFD